MSEARPGVLCLSFGVYGETREQIAHTLPGMDNIRDALLALARALATSSLWPEFRRAVLVVRLDPRPLLGVAGFFDGAEGVRLDMLRWQLERALPGLRYISYAQAERDCRRLARRLQRRLGGVLRDGFHYAAIPRGGHIVLGMLAYALDLPADRLAPPDTPDAPLVVVDDCALSGARFRRFLSGLSSPSVVFAHLYSPPGLRATIEEQEPRVKACVSAHDLEDEAPHSLGEGYASWREHWQRVSGEGAYWFGRYRKLGFAWSEPDTGFWNPVTERREPAWNLLPPELCLKNRTGADPKAARIQIQENGPGPLVPGAGVLFAGFDDTVLIGEAATGGNYALRGVGADMWRALVKAGDLEPALASLRGMYAVDEAVLRRDLSAFAEDLVARGLLEWSRGGGAQRAGR